MALWQGVKQAQHSRIQNALTAMFNLLSTYSGVL